MGYIIHITDGEGGLLADVIRYTGTDVRDANTLARAVLALGLRQLMDGPPSDSRLAIAGALKVLEEVED